MDFLGGGMNKLNQKLVKRPDLLKIMYTHRETHIHKHTQQCKGWIPDVILSLTPFPHDNYH